MTMTAAHATEPGCVLADLLEHQATARPEAIYAIFGDTSTWTFAETLAHTRRTAAGLHHAGLRQGDRLLIALPNGPDINARDTHGRTALHIASYRASEDVLHLLYAHVRTSRRLCHMARSPFCRECGGRGSICEVAVAVAEVE